MKKPVEKKKKIVAAASNNDGEQGRLLAAAVGESVQTALGPLVKGLNNLVSDMGEVKEMLTIQAAAKQDDDDDVEISAAHHEDDEEAAHDDEEMAAHDDEDDEEMSAAHSKQDDSDEEDGEDQEDDEDDDDLDAMEDLEEKPAYRDPGEVNKGAKNKGSQTAVEKVGASGKGVFPKLVKAQGISAGAAIMIKDLVAQAARKHRKQLKMVQASAEKRERRLVHQIERLQAQAERFAEMESRRSVIPIELTNLAAKSNIDLREYQQSGTKMSPETVDRMFAGSGLELDPVQRMTFKNRLSEMGLLDEGTVERPWNTRQLQ